jgi:dihydroorotase-like cyclic amidohydrolase
LGGISQFRTKGRVQVGADADIVVFNPDTVSEITAPTSQAWVRCPPPVFLTCW